MKATTYLKNIHRIIPVAFRQYIENSFVDKQRLFIYIYATVGSVLILDINLLGVSGPYGSYFYVANMCAVDSVYLPGFYQETDVSENLVDLADVYLSGFHVG